MTDRVRRRFEKRSEKVGSFPFLSPFSSGRKKLNEWRTESVSGRTNWRASGELLIVPYLPFFRFRQRKNPFPPRDYRISRRLTSRGGDGNLPSIYLLAGCPWRADPRQRIPSPATVPANSIAATFSLLHPPLPLSLFLSSTYLFIIYPIFIVDRYIRSPSLDYYLLLCFQDGSYYAFMPKAIRRGKFFKGSKSLPQNERRCWGKV